MPSTPNSEFVSVSNGMPVGWTPEERDAFLLKAAQSVAEATTGVKYDAGKPRMDLISPFALEELGKVLAYGAKKYADRNWEKGFPWSRIIGATMRHTVRYMMGETIDPETGLSHMAAVMCNAMFLLHFERTKRELDDRPQYDGVKQ